MLKGLLNIASGNLSLHRIHKRVTKKDVCGKTWYLEERKIIRLQLLLISAPEGSLIKKKNQTSKTISLLYTEACEKSTLVIR